MTVTINSTGTHERVTTMSRQETFINPDGSLNLLTAQNAKAVTMLDIAQKLHLSVATVSRALNGSSQIGNKTAGLVKNTAAEMGFVINADARRLRMKHLQTTATEGKRVTINDLARQLKISVSTVSRCFAANGDVSRKTRARVLKAARDAGFTMQAHARRLRNKQRPVIGVLLPSLASHSVIGILQGIEEEAVRSGLDIMICNSFSSPSLTNRQNFLTAIDALIFIQDSLPTGELVVNGFPDHKPMIVLSGDKQYDENCDPLEWGRLTAGCLLQQLFANNQPN